MGTTAALRNCSQNELLRKPISRSSVAESCIAEVLLPYGPERKTKGHLPHNTRRGGMACLPVGSYPRWTAAMRTSEDSPSLLAHYQHGAVGVPDHRVRDAAHQRPPYPAVPPVTHHYQPSTHAFGQVDDLFACRS
jgi:hypothetical protein